jgi:hypothetical protein
MTSSSDLEVPTRCSDNGPPESPFLVEFAPDVLTAIRQAAMEAFRSIPYGGLEIGGVLFGRVLPDVRNPGTVEVLASRPIDCSHVSGPAFVLSTEEEDRLTDLFERARLEDELACLAVVGFWVSHGRSELGLTPHDSDLYQAFFPHSWQIALALKPDTNQPLIEALFCRVEGHVFPYRPPAVPTALLPEPRPEPLLGTLVAPRASELPPFATDIYLPRPPVEPPSSKVWAKELYRPVRLLHSAVPQSEPAALLAAEERTAEVEPEPDEELIDTPRLRSYWEAPDPEVIPESKETPPEEPLPAQTDQAMGSAIAKAAELEEKLKRLLAAIQEARAETLRSASPYGSVRIARNGFGLLTVLIVLLMGLLLGGVISYFVFASHRSFT